MFSKFLRRIPFRKFRIAAPTGLALTSGLALFSVGKFAHAAEMKDHAKQMQNLFFGHPLGPENVAKCRKYACDKGLIDRATFIQAFNELGVHDDDAIASYFDCLKTDGQDSIPFELFAMSVVIAGLPHTNTSEKLDFVFRCCDLSGDGLVEKQEVKNLVHALMVSRERLITPTNTSESPVVIPIAALEIPVSEKKRKELDMLRAVYEEFPDMKKGHETIENCLDSFAGSLSNEIFAEIRTDYKTSKGPALSYKQFQRWVADKGENSQFLYSLLDGFELHDFRETDNYKSSWENVRLLDGSHI